MANGSQSFVSLEEHRRSRSSPNPQYKDPATSATGGGGGGGGGDMTDISREEVIDKIAISEAKTDTKFAELRGDLKELKSDLLRHLDQLPTKRDIFNFYTTVIVIAIGIVAAIFAAIAITDARYVGYLARIPVTVIAQPATPPAPKAH